MAIAYFIKPGCNGVEYICYVQPCGMHILNVELNGIEEFFHGVVEDAKVCSSPDDVFFDDFDFLDKFVAALMEIVDEMLILIVFASNYLPW